MMTTLNEPHQFVTINGKQRYHESAPNDIDIDNFKKVIESRRSVRKFTQKQIPKEILDDCLDLAMLAPNSSGLQPWTFYVVKSTAKRKALVKACMGQLAASTAQELIVCIARTDRVDEFARQMLKEWPLPTLPPLVKRYYQLIPMNYALGPLNTFSMLKRGAVSIGGIFAPVPRGPFTYPDLKLWAAKSTALACENLVLALRAYGYDSCMMEGYDEVRVRKLLNLSSHEFPIMVIGAGERADDGVFWPQVRFDRSLFIRDV